MRTAMGILLAATCLIAAGCGGGPAVDPNGPLIYAQGDDAKTLDPGSMEEGFSSQVAHQIFEGLVRFKIDSLEIEPCLATHWERSEDGRVWTFHLREGVAFHDGTPLTAEAVEVSLMRLIDENHPHHIPGGMPYADYALKGIVREVVAVDEMTAEVRLFEPYAPLLKNLAMFCCFIVSPEALEQYGRDIGSNPVGTGPFKFVSWRRDAEIQMVRYEDYWDEPAAWPALTIKTIRDPDVRLFSLARGEIHMMDGIEPQIARQVRENPNLALIEDQGVNLGFVYLNTQVPPLDDKRVRQALNYAVNKEAICEHLFEGLAIPARGIFPPGVPGHDPDGQAYMHNPEKARELLAEAGYDPSTEIELLAYTIPRPYNPLGARLAEVIQNDLAEVGVQVNIAQLEFAALLERSLEFKHQMCMLGWITDNGDPDNYAYALLANPENRAQFKNGEFNELVARAQRTYDEERRLELYKQAQAIALEEAPWLFLNTFNDLLAARREVRGIHLHPTGSHRLWTAWLETPQGSEP